MSKTVGNPVAMNLDLEELVGRNFESPDLSALEAKCAGKTVMVTGAGGSIGSELAAQLSKMEIKTLILLDNSEFNLYRVHESLNEQCEEGGIQLVPTLTNICEYSALENLFLKYRPDFIYHAAAFKHVHLVEANPQAGILNNIAGTQNLLNLCVLYGIEKFTLISTDKAVRPTNLMGATKRVCELMMSHYATKHGLDLCAVRFGNVAGSSGSLIPKLFGQVRRNKPLTITDKRMTRYFMLIPEAVGLVLSASETCKKGDIALLNMGSPVRIIDIAKKLIKLCGKDETSYPIKFTGPRPGEKLFEELSLEGEDLFRNNERFATLKNGDTEFSTMIFNGKPYKDILQAVFDILFYANNNSQMSVNLLWAAIDSDFAIQESVQEEEKEVKNKLSLSQFKVQVA
ncbi:MAG: polysaccharide biosynthesis protein [Bacteriovoracaceae bacterium]|nr:polysaccharide biosynthesis protein [Bacteriovoracaceae bacterium]